MNERDFQRLINQRIEEFVADITELARKHAVQTLADALQIPTAGPSTAERGGRRKRSPAELERQKEEVLGFVEENPGAKMQEIAAEFGVTPRSLTLPMKKLIADGAVRSEGQRRATRYYPAKKRRRSS